MAEMVQHGVRSKAFARGGVYVPIERHIRAFADTVLGMLARQNLEGTVGYRYAVIGSLR